MCRCHHRLRLRIVSCRLLKKQLLSIPLQPERCLRSKSLPSQRKCKCTRCSVNLPPVRSRRLKRRPTTTSMPGRWSSSKLLPSPSRCKSRLRLHEQNQRPVCFHPKRPRSLASQGRFPVLPTLTTFHPHWSKLKSRPRPQPKCFHRRKKQPTSFQRCLWPKSLHHRPRCSWRRRQSNLARCTSLQL